MKSRSILLPALFALMPVTGMAQLSKPKDPLNIMQVKTWAGLYMPTADLGKRFGPSSMVGLEFGYQFKSGWTLGAGAGHLFGNNVIETGLLSNLTTPSGDIITANGVYEDYRLRTFGWTMYARAGKVLPLFGPNVNSGLLLDLGFGIMQHKIWIETPVLNSPQLEGDYKKGYDRLSNGISLNQFIGYQHLSNNKRINFYIGLDIHEGFTRNRRSMDYDTGITDHRQRLDVLVGLKAGWILPLYRRAEKELMFY